ncbi:MAG: NAD(P)H-dependent oxidoreductase subunit E [Gammaproteobacteria bacterium]|nr:NAD(P)H-dependent oxidoreductase subunit E [Gammaproteobacteria bacterium]
MSLSAEVRESIRVECAKYPPEQQRSAVMAALTAAQSEHGFLDTGLMDEVAALLELRPIQVYEIATFYSMYDLEPVGRTKICVCTNVSCMLCGSDTVLEHLKERLGIGPGQVTEDGRVSIHEVECLAACGGAPALQIGTTYHENLTPQKIDRLLEQLP